VLTMILTITMMRMLLLMIDSWPYCRRQYVVLEMKATAVAEFRINT
jgi:hypothetical protein